MGIISKIKGSQATNKSDGSANKCRRIRTWLYEAMNRRIGLEANWVQQHVASCPRCRLRLASVGRVSLALSAMKAEPHRSDLLMRANAQAIDVLKHSLRLAPEAGKLKTMLPRPGLLEKCGVYGHSVANLAACVVILFLMKVGVFSSMGKFQTEGREVVKNYYASQAGQDLANEIFTT